MPARQPPSDVSHAIQTVTEESGFSVVRSLVGHGIGRAMHEDPQIPNYGAPGRGPELAAGMTFAIEPMINAGGPDIYLHDDNWSISTVDGGAFGTFRAHGRDHGRGAANPHSNAVGVAGIAGGGR